MPGKGANIEGLTSDTQAALAGLLEEARRQGLKVRVTSAFRDRAEQEHLYDLRQRGLNPYPVAKPGTSGHEHGEAVDLVNDGPGGQEALAKLAEKHGLRWKGNADRVHFDFSGPRTPSSGLGFGVERAAAAFVQGKASGPDKDVALLHKKFGGATSGGSLDDDLALLHEKFTPADPDVALLHKKFSGAAPAAPARMPNPHVQLDKASGRVIDPSTGQPFPTQFQKNLADVSGRSIAGYDVAPDPNSRAAKLAGAGLSEEPGFVPGLKNTMSAAAGSLARVGAPLYPLREVFNSLAEESSRVSGANPNWRNYTPEQMARFNHERRAALLRGLVNSHPWTAFVKGARDAEPTDFTLFTRWAKNDPAARKQIENFGGPAVWDFLGSMPVDAVTGMIQGKVVGAMEHLDRAGANLPQWLPGKLSGKQVVPALRLQDRAEKAIPKLGRMADERRAYRAAGEAHNLHEAYQEPHLQEAGAFAEDVRQTSQRALKQGAKIRVKDPITKRVVNKLDELVSDWLEAGSRGSRHSGIHATPELEPELQVLDNVLATARTKGAAAVKKLLSEDPTLAQKLELGAERGRQRVADLLAQAKRTRTPAEAAAAKRAVGAEQAAQSQREKLIAALGVKGRARVQALQSEARIGAMGQRGGRALKGMLAQADMHAAGDAAALSQYNEVTNALGQALPPGELAEILSRMKQAGRDAVARAVEAGQNAEAAAASAAAASRKALLARLGSSARAKVQGILKARTSEDAAREVLMQRLAAGGKRGVQEALAAGGPDVAAMGARGKGAVQGLLSQPDTIAPMGARGAARVKGLLAGTAPTEAQGAAEAAGVLDRVTGKARGQASRILDEATVARRAAELEEVKKAAQSLGVDYSDVERLGQRAQGLVDRLGQELVSKGLLSKNAYERLKGAYGPRLYLLTAGDVGEGEQLLQTLERQGLIEPQAAGYIRAEMRQRARRPGAGADFTKAREIETYAERVNPAAARIAVGEATPAVTRYTSKATKELAEAGAMEEIARNPKLAVTREMATPEQLAHWHPEEIGGVEHLLHPGVTKYLEFRNSDDLVLRVLKEQVSPQAAHNWRRLNQAMRRLWVSSPRTAVNNAAGNYQLGAGTAAINSAEYNLPGYAGMVKRVRDWRKTKKATGYLKEAEEKTDLLTSGTILLPRGATRVSSGFGVETTGQKLRGIPGRLYEGYANTAYRDVEQAGRAYLYQELRKSGKSVDEAARIVRAAMVDYSDIGPFRRLMERNNILPFITFPTKAIFQYMNLVLRRPDLFNTYTGERLRSFLDEFADERAVAQGLHPEAKAKRQRGEVGLTQFPIPGMRGPHGEQQYQQTSLLAPILQGAPTSNDADALTPIEDRLKSAFPLARVPFEMMTNHSFFTGKPIVEPGSIPGTTGRITDVFHNPELGGIYGRYLARAFVPQASDAERLYRAATGTVATPSRFSPHQGLVATLLQGTMGVQVREGIADSPLQAKERAGLRADNPKNQPFVDFATAHEADLLAHRARIDPQYVDYLKGQTDSRQVRAMLEVTKRRLPDLITSDAYTGPDKQGAIRRMTDWLYALADRYEELVAGQEAAPALGAPGAGLGGH